MITGGAETPLRERDAELDQIRHAVTAAAGGQGQVVVVEGPAGIGKSSLLRAARTFARDGGIRCLSARGSELESRFPFGMVHQLFDPVVLPAPDDERDGFFGGAARLARPLFEDGEPLDRGSSEALYQRLHGLHWLVTNLAAQEPLVIAFDDAQWADEASLEFVSFLMRRLEDLPVLMVVGTRPVSDAGWPLLARLTTDASASVLRPSPLTRESVDAWVREVLSSDADVAFAEACHASTSGIPFLVHELLREVAAERLQPTAAEARRVGALTPEGVMAVVGLRMASMPPGSVELARAVSVLGDGVSVGLAAALTDLDAATAAEASTALVRAGIFEARGGLAFTHPLVRTTVYEGMVPAERSAAHAQAARLLRSRLATADQIAAHLLLADPSGEPEVVETLTAAARRAAEIGALGTARAYLERALVEPPPDDACAAILTDLGRVEGRLGVEAAVPRLEQAMDVAPDLAARATAALELARILKFGGQGVRGVEVLEPFEARTAELEPELGRLISLEYLGFGWLSSGARRRLGSRVDDLVDPGEPRTNLEAFALAALAFNAAAYGESAEVAADRAGRAAASDLLPSDPADGGYGTLIASVALLWSDRYGEAQRHMDRMLREGRRRGSRIAFAAASSMLGVLNLRRGALYDADRDAMAAIELGREGAGTEAFLTAAYGTYGDVGVDRGLPEAELRARLAALDSAVHDVDAQPYDLVQHAQGRLEVALGDYDAGIEHLHATGRSQKEWGAACPTVCPWRTSLALAYRDAGDRAAARRVADEDVELARRFGAARALGMALRAQALVADDVVAGLRESVAVLEDSPARLELTRALVDLGAELRREGQGGSAVPILRRGQELASRCGARGVAQVAHDELLAAGAEPVPLHLTAADLLDPAEQRVAELAARGHDERAIAEELMLTEAAVSERLGTARKRLGVGPNAAPTPAAATGAIAAAGPLDYGHAVREALRDYERPVRLAASPLARGESPDERAESVREKLRDAVEKAFGAAHDDQLMKSVLVRGYIDSAASHEEAADELHVSRSTYFRRLREGTERVAEYLEAAGRRAPVGS